MTEKTQPFKFTEKQEEARDLISEVQYFMLFGGSRSGKTFIAMRQLAVRAMKSPGSRHAVLRFRFNAVKASIIYDTFPKMMQLCFPNITYTLNKTDWFAQFENGAEIWFGGLDDKDRTEKILGQEYATIYLNECSQIPWSSVGIAKTRLAQNCKQADGTPLALRMFFDCNPPDKNHWTYKTFIQKQDPDTKKKLIDEDEHGWIQMNPGDNQENLPASYIKTLQALPPHLRKRFLEGEFKDANPNALFREEDIERWRVEDPADCPDFARIVVGVDPSGSGDDEDNSRNDEIGIFVAALGTDGTAYLIEDATIQGGPTVWGKMAVSAYHRHQADVLVGETNFGGGMVKFVLKTADPAANYKMVTASRGKVQRAEPFSPLFADGRIRVVGKMTEFEEELTGFSTYGFTGDASPNRADAAFWALAELFPGMVKPKVQQLPKARPVPVSNHW